MCDSENYSDTERKYYVLAADIDLSEETDWDGPSFAGHFDGQNHTIIINSQNNIAYAGLFEEVGTEDGEIAIRNLNVTGTVAANCAGTLVHYLESGIVENCTFTGTITRYSDASSFGAGGLIAHINGGTVRNCTVRANITAGAYAGGIAGEASGGSIINCTVEDSSTLTAETVGGIAGSILTANLTLSGNKWPSRYTETPSDSPIDPDPPEPVTSFTWNAHTYTLYNESLTWEQAKLRCEALGGHLATITTQAEQNAVSSSLPVISGKYWLGAKADSAGWWSWVTGEPFEGQYRNYAAGQPDGSGSFLVMTGGLWDDVRNDDYADGFICETDSGPQEIVKAAPNDEFTEWLNNPTLWQQGDGARPSPVDVSHLEDNPPQISSGTFRASDALPEKYDTREHSGLPAVRRQGIFGTCWAFSTIGAMEANCMKQGITALGAEPDLSELHLAWFLVKTSADFERQSSSILMEGGDPIKADGFLTSHADSAPVLEAEMPYENASRIDAEVEAFTAGKTFAKAPVRLIKTINVGNIRNSIATEAVKQYVMDYGAVYFKYYHDKNGFNPATKALYSESKSAEMAHAALLVGWDDTFSVDNFSENMRPSAPGAWLVRDSNQDDGHSSDGYFWLSYSQGRTTGFDEGYVFIVSDDISGKKNITHNEGGQTGSINLKWSANIFQSMRNENLVTITIKTTDNNAHYAVYVNNLGKNKPSAPGSVTEPVLSGFMPHAGTQVFDLARPVELYAGDYYSVIVWMDTRYDKPTAVETSIPGYFTASVKEGESYFASGDQVPAVWLDGSKLSGDVGPCNALVSVATIGRQSQESAPSITTASLPAGKTGEHYDFTMSASGTGQIEWRSGGLPAGFALSPEGVLSGSSDTAVNEEVNITAFNNAGYDTKSFMLSVSGGNLPPEPKPDDNTKSSSGGGCSTVPGSLLMLAGAVIIFRKGGR